VSKLRSDVKPIQQAPGPERVFHDGPLEALSASRFVASFPGIVKLEGRKLRPEARVLAVSHVAANLLAVAAYPNRPRRSATVATQTKSSSSNQQRVEESVERIRELNERIVDSSRKAGVAYLDAYERILKSLADFEERVGGASQVEWISALAQAQADFTRDFTRAYTSAARGVLE
jgi:hypothetical protein